MKKQFTELRELLLSIDSKHFTWNDARADVLNQLHDLQSKAENLSISNVSFSLQAEAVEFAEWIRAFESLERQHGFWVIEGQISSEDLYKGFLKDRERWRNES